MLKTINLVFPLWSGYYQEIFHVCGTLCPSSDYPDYVNSFNYSFSKLNLYCIILYTYRVTCFEVFMTVTAEYFKIIKHFHRTNTLLIKPWKSIFMANLFFENGIQVPEAEECERWTTKYFQWSHYMPDRSSYNSSL